MYIINLSIGCLTVKTFATKYDATKYKRVINSIRTLLLYLLFFYYLPSSYNIKLLDIYFFCAKKLGANNRGLFFTADAFPAMFVINVLFSFFGDSLSRRFVAVSLSEVSSGLCAIGITISFWESNDPGWLT